MTVSLRFARIWAGAPVLALLMTTAGPAQPSVQPPADVPADALVPNEEARTLFETLEENVFTAELMADMPAEAFAPADAIIAQLLAPGEQVPNWQDRGVDLHSIVRAREGGLSGNMTSEPGPFGPMLVYFADQPLGEVVPPEWVLVGRHGEAFEAEIVQVEIEQISPKLVLAERVSYRRQGNALCRVRAESRLYSDPRVAASEMDVIGLFMAMRFLRIFDQRTLCSIIEETSPGQYVARSFDGEGHRLAALDADQQPFRIIGRQPVAAPSAPR